MIIGIEESANLIHFISPSQKSYDKYKLVPAKVFLTDRDDIKAEFEKTDLWTNAQKRQASYVHSFLGTFIVNDSINVFIDDSEKTIKVNNATFLCDKPDDHNYRYESISYNGTLAGEINHVNRLIGELITLAKRDYFLEVLKESWNSVDPEESWIKNKTTIRF